jgi:predicted nucleic acid-binding protein
MINHSHLLLDACCLLNLFASGQGLNILKALPVQNVVTQIVRDDELKTLQTLDYGKNEGAEQFQLALSQGWLTVVDFETEAEAESFLNYIAENLDDGEAATCAIAFQRNWAIATDDKKAISFTKKEAPQIQIISTLALVKYWADQINPDLTELRLALDSIRVKSKYIPHKSHPLYRWWKNQTT